MNKIPFGVPSGTFRVENPDGVFRPDGSHSLYDGPNPLPTPQIPGDYDSNRAVNKKPAQGWR